MKLFLTKSDIKYYIKSDKGELIDSRPDLVLV